MFHFILHWKAGLREGPGAFEYNTLLRLATNEAKFGLPPLGLAGDPLLDLHTDIVILYTVRKPLLMIVIFEIIH